jgi:methyl-accepting chemotaxis protein
MQDESKRRGLWAIARSLPIGLKLFVFISAVVIGLVTFLTSYFASRGVALLERNVVEKGDFVAQQLRTAVAFADKETAREVFEVLHLALFRADGRLLYADGNGLLEAPAAAAAPRLEVEAGRLRVVAPVVSAEGPRGTLVLELDKARLDSEIRAVRLGAWGIGGGGLLLGCLAALLLGRAFSRRIEKVRRAAAAVAMGDLGQPQLDVGAGDEIGQLAMASNAMVESLRMLVQKLSETSAQLEGASDSFLEIVRGHEVSDGLVPGFIELRQYAEDLDQVIARFKLADAPTVGRQERV